jgi:hypothetical protein
VGPKLVRVTCARRVDGPELVYLGELEARTGETARVRIPILNLVVDVPAAAVRPAPAQQRLPVPPNATPLSAGERQAVWANLMALVGNACREAPADVVRPDHDQLVGDDQRFAVDRQTALTRLQVEADAAVAAAVAAQHGNRHTDEPSDW